MRLALQSPLFLALLLIGSQVNSQEAKKVSWGCYGELESGEGGQLLHMRGNTGPGADTAEVRPRFNQKQVLLTLTATAPSTTKVFYPGTNLEASGVSRLYKDPSGNRWRYSYFNGKATWLMIETSSNIHCVPTYK